MYVHVLLKMLHSYECDFCIVCLQLISCKAESNKELELNMKQ